MTPTGTRLAGDETLNLIREARAARAAGTLSEEKYRELLQALCPGRMPREVPAAPVTHGPGPDGRPLLAHALDGKE